MVFLWRPGGDMPGIAILLQINHTIDKQTGGNRESSSPGSGSGFSWGNSPKPMGGSKAFNSGNSSVSVGGGNVNGTNGTGESADEKNMFIGLLDIFGCVDDTMFMKKSMSCWFCFCVFF